jgi:hypothetical protein
MSSRKKLKIGQLGKENRNTWKVLKCGAGEGRRSSAGPIVLEMKESYYYYYYYYYYY